MSNPVSRRSFIQALSTLISGVPFLSKRSAAALAAAAANVPSQRQDLTLWYKEPADRWTDALPVGNGRLGAMVFGGVAVERIALNEDTLWSGAPRDWNNPSAKDHLGVVRKLVIEGQDYQAADQECRKMQGPFNQAYEPLGDLLIEFEQGDESTGYRRALDLDRAVSSVTYTAGVNRIVRETFVSAPDQVIVVQLTGTKPGALNCTLRLKSQLQSKSEAKAKDSDIVLTGKAPANSVPNYIRSENPIVYSDEPGKGMHFAAVLRAKAVDGKIESQSDGALKVNGATQLTLLIGAATGYKSFNEAPTTSLAEVVSKARQPVNAAAGKPYQQLKQRHLEDHRRLFRRVQLDLGKHEAAALPTDERLDNFAQNPDDSLLALYFHYGRYLLLTSSRPGTQPANLQGIWNAELRIPDAL
jgi:alpha-L-fucosidase 2